MRYGRKGGDGPNTGKVAAVYQAVLPDGTTLTKRTFTCTADTVIGTAYRYNDHITLQVWPDEPPADGDFGRLVAKRIK